MEKSFRSPCIIASALDVIGDKWSLLLIRDMLLDHKSTYKEMAASQEGIATNLLSTRLKMLESLEIITKRKLPQNKKENVYLLTDKGIDLGPVILEIVVWSDKHIRPYNETMVPYEGKNLDRTEMIKYTQKAYRKFVRQTLA